MKATCRVAVAFCAGVVVGAVAASVAALRVVFGYLRDPEEEPSCAYRTYNP